MSKSKFNVDADKSCRTCDGIVFDSVMEMKYYRDVLCPNVESGRVRAYELQKEYELQPGFTRGGKPVRPITYVADFYVKYDDGREEVIDVKGCPDTVSKLKRKMFWYVYPRLDYRWVTYVKKWGGWLDYDAVKAMRNEEKRRRKMERENKYGEE